MPVWTIGHSTQPAATLVDALRAHRIELLLDVRRFPMSRRNPQFNQEALAQTLKEAAIQYEHAPGLGGRRSPEANSLNLGLRDPGFRGFADYMWSDEFTVNLEALIERSRSTRLALMCAEAVPWRCHRSLIADALTARGVPVLHLVGGRERQHELSPHARVQEGRVTYPALL
jgi:uncharacterized protein (DUF488 family)